MFKTLLLKTFSLSRINNKCVFPASIITTCRNFRPHPVDLEFSFHSPIDLPSPQTTPVIILHGLLGCRLNWRTIANVITSKYNKQVYTLDARNHGDSPHDDHLDYPSMALDVREFMFKRSISKAILMGHSMGGRTAMTMALTEPAMIEKLVIVDVSPSNMPKSSHNLRDYVITMRDALPCLPPNVSLSEARVILNERMAPSIPEVSVRQFLLTNLILQNGAFKWKANVDVIAEKFFPTVTTFPDLKGEYNGETLFICGGDSPYVSVDDHDYIKMLFPKANFVYIPGAGHWVHSEKPQQFLKALEEIL